MARQPITPNTPDTVIPPDHLIPPTVGKVHFSAGDYPDHFFDTHDLAETGGYYREGRHWRRGDTTLPPIRIPCAFVRHLYIDGPHLTYEMGWCRDV